MATYDGAALLRLARESIAAHLAGRPLPPLPAELEAAPFGGVFVTLKRRGRLRGCIGRFDSSTGLAETVQQVAVSALEDPRFRHQPVTADELPDIVIDISILSPMRRVEDPRALEPGRHGVYLRQGERIGCFLPQVAVEQGWDRDKLLSVCCESKAGLPPDAWKDPSTEVYLFTADVLSETS